MRKALYVLVLFCVLIGSANAQIGIYEQGTVVRMHMGDCVAARHGFMVAFGGPATPAVEEACPEYTLVSNKVVYVIVGKFSNQLIPLAETIDFRLRNNELAVRVDDAKHEARFTIKEMIVRSEWDRVQRHLEQQMTSAENHRGLKTTEDQ